MDGLTERMIDLNERMDALTEELKNEQDHEKRMYSKTFWRSQLKIKKKTQKTIKHVTEYMIDHGITIRTEYHEFGSAEKEEWLTLKYWEVPYPDDTWFEKMDTKVFENEQEVDVFFLTPLFKALGYKEEDFTFEYKVDIATRLLGTLPRGERKKFVDLALFDGTDRSESNLLVVCEAKRSEKSNPNQNRRNLISAEKCLKVYRVGCSKTKRFFATNGDDIKVYKPGEFDIEPYLEMHRSAFKEKWHALYLSLGKPILVGELDG